MFKTILVPIDVSQPDSGESGLKVAAEMAGKTGAKLILLNVTGDIPNLVADQLPKNYMESTRDKASKTLAALASKYKLSQGSYEVQTRHGQIYREILDAAEDGGADLIVIGSHQPGAADYLLGSRAAKVVRHAHCSVLVVRH